MCMQASTYRSSTTFSRSAHPSLAVPCVPSTRMAPALIKGARKGEVLGVRGRTLCLALAHEHLDFCTGGGQALQRVAQGKGMAGQAARRNAQDHRRTPPRLAARALRRGTLELRQRRLGGAGGTARRPRLLLRRARLRTRLRGLRPPHSVRGHSHELPAAGQHVQLSVQCLLVPHSSPHARWIQARVWAANIGADWLSKHHTRAAGGGEPRPEAAISSSLSAAADHFTHRLTAPTRPPADFAHCQHPGRPSSSSTAPISSCLLSAFALPTGPTGRQSARSSRRNPRCRQQRRQSRLRAWLRASKRMRRPKQEGGAPPCFAARALRSGSCFSPQSLRGSSCQAGWWQ